MAYFHPPSPSFSQLTIHLTNRFRKNPKRPTPGKFFLEQEGRVQHSKMITEKSNLFVVATQGKTVCRYPALRLEEESSCSILGQPSEISLLIGTFLGPKNLARAQAVSKAWYKCFGKESLWIPHLPPSIAQMLYGRPAKVEVAYQSQLKNSWMGEDISVESVTDTHVHKSNLLIGATMPSDGSWILTFGTRGSVGIWRGIGSENVRSALIAGEETDHDPHSSECIFGGAASPRGLIALTYGRQGYVVKWTGFESGEITGTRIGGTLSMNPHSSTEVFGGAISPDETWGLTGGEEGRVVYWTGLNTDSPIGRMVIEDMALNPHKATQVMRIRISSDGSFAMSISEGIAVIWKGFLTGKISGTAIKENPHQDDDLWSCVISLDGSMALTAGNCGRVVKWKDLKSENPTGILLAGEELPENNPHDSDSIHSIKISSDNSWGVTMGYKKAMIFTQTNNKDRLSWRPLPFTFLEQSEESPRRALISPRNEWVVGVGESILYLWKPMGVHLIETECK